MYYFDYIIRRKNGATFKVRVTFREKRAWAILVYRP